MKKIINIVPISNFEYKMSHIERWEIEYYSDGTDSIALAIYRKK